MKIREHSYSLNVCVRGVDILALPSWCSGPHRSGRAHRQHVLAVVCPAVAFSTGGAHTSGSSAGSGTEEA